MDSHNQSLETLTEIRDLMQRSSKFLSLSGLSGIFAGIVALGGALVAYLRLKTDALSYDGMSDVSELTRAFCAPRWNHRLGFSINFWGILYHS